MGFKGSRVQIPPFRQTRAIVRRSPSLHFSGEAVKCRSHPWPEIVNSAIFKVTFDIGLVNDYLFTELFLRISLFNPWFRRRGLCALWKDTGSEEDIFIQRAMDSEAAFGEDMGIDHCGADVAMSEELLDGSDIVSLFEEVCCERVAE